MVSENQKNEGTIKSIGSAIGLIVLIGGTLLGAQKYIAVEIEKHLTNAPHSDTAAGGAYLSSIPPGAVIAFADAPTGSIKRNCAALPGGWVDFAAAGGRFILGAGQLRTDTYRAGQEGGSSTFQLTENHLPAHDHGFVSTFDGGKTLQWSRDDHLVATLEQNKHFLHDFNYGSSEPTPVQVMPPYIALTFCKKE